MMKREDILEKFRSEGAVGYAHVFRDLLTRSIQVSLCTVEFNQMPWPP